MADNRTHSVSEWDDPALARLLEQLREEDALDGVGFDEAEIERLVAQIDADEVDLSATSTPMVSGNSTASELGIRSTCGSPPSKTGDGRVTERLVGPLPHNESAA